MTKHFLFTIKLSETTICIIIFLLAFTNFASAQKVSQRSSKKSACQVGDVSFACPKGFKPMPSKGQENYALLFRRKYSYSLFVALPTQSSGENNLISEVLKASSAILFPKESQEFKFNSYGLSNDSAGKVSAKQIGGGAIKAFNGNLTVLEKYFLLKVKDKEIIAGYVSELDKSNSAKDTFESTGAEVYSACFDLTELIYSITGEKVSMEKNPCNITVIQTKSNE